MSCGCGTAGCSCNVTGGDGLTVTGSGTKSNPYVVTAYGGSSTLDTADTPSVVWDLTGSGTMDDPYVLTANASTPVTPPVSQVFTANGTWTKPAGVGTVRVYISGGGGGGAGGGMQNTALAADFRSAKGGGGGNYMWRDFAAADVPASVAVTVGVGGTGGAGATAVGSGANGTAGGTSSFGSLLSMAGGVAGTTVTNPASISTGPNGGGMTGLAPGGGGYGGTPLFGSPVTTVRTNLVPNPSFETNITGYAIYGAVTATLSRVAVSPTATDGGGFALRATGNGTSNAMNIMGPRMPVTAGKPYDYQASFQRNGPGWSSTPPVRTWIYWFNAAGTNISTTEMPTVYLLSSPPWFKNPGSTTAPAGATSASIRWGIYPGSTVTSGTFVNIDTVLFTPGTGAGFTAYFDGNTPDDGFIDYAWTGTVNNSTSTQTITSGPITFSSGGPGGSVPVPSLAGGGGGAGGGTVTAPGLAGNATAGQVGAANTTLTNRPGGSGGGGGGSGKVSAVGGNGVAGSGGGGGGTGYSPGVGFKGGNGGTGFVTVIAW